MQHINYLNTLKGKYRQCTLKGEPWQAAEPGPTLVFLISLVLDFIHSPSLSSHLIRQGGGWCTFESHQQLNRDFL